MHDGARDAQPLLLAAGERDRRRFFVLQQSDLIERRTHAPRRVLRAVARNLQRQRNVIEDVAVEQQLVVLEHQAEIAAQERHRAPLQHADILAVHEHSAGCRPLDRDQQFQQRGLAGAGMAGDEHQLPGLDREPDVAQRLMAAGIAFRDVAEGNHKGVKREA